MQSNSNSQSNPTQPQQTNPGLASNSLFGAYQTNVQQPSLFTYPQQINQSPNVNTTPSIFNHNPHPQFNLSNSYVPQVQTTLQQFPVQQQSYPPIPQQAYYAPPQQQTMPSYSYPSFFGNVGNNSLRSQVESLKTTSFADDELI